MVVLKVQEKLWRQGEIKRKKPSVQTTLEKIFGEKEKIKMNIWH